MAKFCEIKPSRKFEFLQLRSYHSTNKTGVWHDLNATVNDRVISSLREGFIFTKLRNGEVLRKKTLAKFSVFTVIRLC